jgi:hypothetical protein
MWWILGLILGLLLLFWQSKTRKFVAHAIAAQRALPSRNWDEFDRMVGVAKATANGFKRRRVKDQCLGEILLLAAQGAYWREEFDEVEAEAKAAIEHTERAGAPDGPMKLSIAHRLLGGDMYFDRNDLAQAEEQFRASAQPLEFGATAPLAIFSL